MGLQLRHRNFSHAKRFDRDDRHQDGLATSVVSAK